MLTRIPHIRLRVFAWCLCLGVSAYFCVLLQATGFDAILRSKEG